jgi:hypothetical protein
MILSPIERLMCMPFVYLEVYCFRKA